LTARAVDVIRFGMRFGLSDTPVEVERIQASILARRTPEARMSLALELSAEVIRRSQDAVRCSMPGADVDAVMTRWVLLHHGERIAGLFAEGRRRLNAGRRMQSR